MVTIITYLRVIKNFGGAEEDGDSVAETNFPGMLTGNGLIFVGKEHTTKSTKIYTPQKFLRVRYMQISFAGFTLRRHKGPSVNRSIRLITDIFGQLLFRLTVP